MNRKSKTKKKQVRATISAYRDYVVICGHLNVEQDGEFRRCPDCGLMLMIDGAAIERFAKSGK